MYAGKEHGEVDEMTETGVRTLIVITSKMLLRLAGDDVRQDIEVDSDGQDC